MHKTVLVVVLALDSEPWRSIQALGQKSTWASSDSDLPIFWLHGLLGGPSRQLIRIGNKSLQVLGFKRALRIFRRRAAVWAAGRKVSLEGSRIQTRVPETYLMTNAKTVAGFRHLLRTYEFDYILRTNSSTYVNLKMLEDFVQGLPSEGYYGGTTWRAHGVDYVTGTSILLSRDLVKHVAYDPEWNFDVIDDLAVGMSMARAEIIPKPIPRIDICSSGDLAALDPVVLASSFIVRCKGLEDRQHDIRAMQRVHELYGH